MSGYSLFDEIENQETHKYEENLALAKKAVEDRLGKSIEVSSNKHKSLDKALEEHHNKIQEIVSEFLIPIPATLRRVKSTFKKSPKKKITSAWRFDKDFNGWVSEANSKMNFLCDSCGRTLAKLGYQNCKCGKIWNGYSIDNKGETTSSSKIIVWREVEDRNNMIVAATPPRRDMSINDRDTLKEIEDSSEEYEDRISEEPIYDYDTKEALFVEGYLDALNNKFLMKDANVFYKEGYKSALGIE